MTQHHSQSNPPRPAMVAIPGLDVERGLRFASGRLDHYLGRLRKYASTHADAASELRAAYAYRDAAELAHVAHTLRGVAAFLGAPSLQTAATALEIGLRHEPDWHASARDVEAVCEAHEALLHAIAAFEQQPALVDAA